MANPRKDLTGQRFGKLVVLGLAGVHKAPNGHVTSLSKVECDCGNVRVVHTRSFNNGLISCGCATETHGMSGSPTHKSWTNMLSRCYNVNNPRYADWGGRGIRVCNRWRNNFKNFLDDMGERPNGLTLDRKDNDGDYCKNNCRWATRVEQQANRRGSYGSKT